MEIEIPMEMKLCLWCKTQTPKAKTGWVKYPPSIDEHILFCSKKCLSLATIGGKWKILNIKKIFAKHGRLKRKEQSDKLKQLLRKTRLSDEDLAELFSYLNRNQKDSLALIGLANLSARCFRDPQGIWSNINNEAGVFEKREKN